LILGGVRYRECAAWRHDSRRIRHSRHDKVRLRDVDLSIDARQLLVSSVSGTTFPSSAHAIQEVHAQGGVCAAEDAAIVLNGGCDSARRESARIEERYKFATYRRSWPPSGPQFNSEGFGEGQVSTRPMTQFVAAFRVNQ